VADGSRSVCTVSSHIPDAAVYIDTDPLLIFNHGPNKISVPDSFIGGFLNHGPTKQQQAVTAVSVSSTRHKHTVHGSRVVTNNLKVA